MVNRRRSKQIKKTLLFLVPFFLFSSMVKEVLAMPEILDESEVTEILDAGTYPIRFKTVTDEGTEIEEVRVVTVTEPHTIISKTYAEAIDAKDFRTTKKIKDLSQTELFELSKVKAWNTYDGAQLQVTGYSVNHTRTSNAYRVSFSTDNGTTVTVTGSEVMVPETTSKQSKKNTLLVKEKYTLLNYSSISMTGPIGENPYKQKVVILGSSFSVTFVFIVGVYFFANKRMKQTSDLLYKE